MESQVHLEKIKQPTSRLNLLDAKAQSSIRRHQVKDFINAGSKSSATNFVENDENSQLASHLLQLKTSCSGVKVQIKHSEFKQYRYKDETHLISSKVKAIQTERGKLEVEIAKLQNVVEDVKSKETNATLCYKSYEHILDRMKKDDIMNQIKRNELDKELKHLSKTYKDLNNKNLDLKEFGYLSTIGLKEAQGEVEELKQFRRTTLASMSRVVGEKEVLEKKKQDRKDKSDMIKEMAAGDLQDADMIRLKKFFAVQVFLKALLKGKIQKLKDFYEPYELAFLKIKGNTNVKDANSLKAEYQNFESTYNEKAIWVKHLEDEISSGESIRKSLKQEVSQLKIKEMEILQQIEEEDSQPEIPIKKEIQEKAQSSQVLMMSVREWLKQQLRKMGLDSSNKTEGEMLKEICSTLRKGKETVPSEEENRS